MGEAFGLIGGIGDYLEMPLWKCYFARKAGKEGEDFADFHAPKGCARQL